MEDLPGSGNSLLSPWDPSPAGVQRDPLLTVQHTRFACGGVTVGVRLASLVGDASGFLQLYRDLAEMYRGLEPDKGDDPTLGQPPHIIPFLMEQMAETKTSEERAGALTNQPLGYSAGPIPEVLQANEKTEAAVHSPPPVVGRELYFSAAELAALKAHAMPSNSGLWLSTFSALSAQRRQRIPSRGFSHNPIQHRS